MYIEIDYKIVGNKNVKKELLKVSADRIKTTDFTLKILEKPNMELSILPITPIEIVSVSIVIDYSYGEKDKIFINGYQSWTDSKEVQINHKDKKFPRILKSTIKKYKFEQYGNYNFYKYKNKNGIFHSVNYTYIKSFFNEVFFIGSLNDNKSFTFIEHNTNTNKIYIKKDMVGKIIDSEEKLFSLFMENVDNNKIFEKYFELLGLKKKDKKIMRGWTSWYNYYENITEDIILQNLKNFESKNIKIDYFQIDDGYQNAVGDWLQVNAKFPNGMKYLADEIKDSGLKAGIWLAPFSAEKKSNLVKEHPEWILKDEKGEFVYGGSNWSSFYALDIYNEEFRIYLKEVFDTMINYWGYEMFKLDFLYSACLMPRKGKARGEVMWDAMKFLREIIGDKEILACGVPIISAFGIADYCRTGCDIGLDWDDKFYMKYFHRERISTKNAIKNSIYRYHMDTYAFYNDPDVFLLRNDNIQLDKKQKETLFWVNNLFGTLLFTSDNISEYNRWQNDFYKKSFEIKSKEILSVSEDRDLFEINALINNKKRTFIINLDKKDRIYKGKKVEAFATEYF